MELQPVPPGVGSPPQELPPATGEEGELVERLRRGEDSAFAALLDRYGAAMLRFARLYTDDAAAAEDALQETWIAVLRGIDRFQGRASLRTWIFRILVNRIRTRLRRESRFVSLSSMAGEPAVEPGRFLHADHPRWPHHWKVPPASWGESPEQRLLSAEVRELIEREISALPPGQREVVTLRDVEGWGSREVCNLLGISESNQRVLLHRARCRVRRALESYLGGG